MVKDEKKISDCELKGTPSPSKAGSVQDPPQSGGKTPRRIRPTQLESFPSPRMSAGSSCADTPPPSSPSAPPTANSSAPPTARSSGPPTVASKTVNLSDKVRNEGPRRVNFITLAKFNDKKEVIQTAPNCIREQKQDRVDSTCAKKNGEPMEIQTTE